MDELSTTCFLTLYELLKSTKTGSLTSNPLNMLSRMNGEMISKKTLNVETFLYRVIRFNLTSLLVGFVKRKYGHTVYLHRFVVGVFGQKMEVGAVLRLEIVLLLKVTRALQF